VTSLIPIFVNERALRVAAGATLSQVLAEFEPDLFAALLGGRVLATDARAIPVDVDAPVAAGSIFRVRESARLGGTADA
jgi:hypothetical protein